tara:strand:- start:7488 stop:8993 length:1506 start_codon:yes stop_codon:yes gene_type:complete
MSFHIRDKNGFTIIELIIAGAISITMIGVGFSVLQIGLKGNKIEETRMGLSGQLNDALDFILDEVKAGKSIINKESDITSLNNNCTYPDSGEFLFGIRLPDQALAKDDYESDGFQLTLNQVECPIVYTLRESNNNEKLPFSLVRYGPKYNDKGYYISPSYEEFEETVLLDGVSDEAQYDKISCPENWNAIQTIKGISYCIDEYNKSIEIQIETEGFLNNSEDNSLRSVASTGGFSMIQDESQISLYSIDSENINSEAPDCMGLQCCWIGVCLKTNKIVYMIDRSKFMSKDYDGHPNGSIVNGRWIQDNSDPYISPRINGKSLFEYSINTLKQHINRLPSSSMVGENSKFYLQIIAFNSSSKYLFTDDPWGKGPQEMTQSNKNNALKFLDDLLILDGAEGDSIEPWYDICKALESDDVGQIIILSSSFPSTIVGNCAEEEGNYSEIIDNYNKLNRSKRSIGSLTIDSISLFQNFCEVTKNYYNNNWLGLISSGSESYCSHIK